MVIDKSESDRVSVIDQSFALLEYLSAVAREIQIKPVRNVHDHNFTLWPEDVPDSPAVRVGQTGQGLCWLEVERLPLPEPVDIPEHLLTLLQHPEAIRTPFQIPQLDTTKVSDFVEEIRNAKEEQQGTAQEPAPSSEQLVEEINTDFSSWLADVWTPWNDKVRPVFAVRSLYDRLYELRLKADALSASHEIVWGHLVLSHRAGQDSIVAPMLTANAIVEVDEDSGTIRVRLERDLELELDALEGTELTGVEALAQLQANIRRYPVDIWHPEIRLATRRQILAPLGVDAEFYDGTEPAPPRATLRLNDGWVLFMRKRPVRQQRFYGELANKIREERFVPEALASVVADSTRVDDAVVSLGQAVSYQDKTADRLMMPLPANEQQERIVKQLANSRGVTVQGPPGTGKSHTIVNLVSHLVAHGKRVLVTAENEQALSVLRDKFPPQIRDLSIAVLDSTPAAMEDLRSAAQSMQDALSALDEDQQRRRIHELEEQIDTLRLNLQRLDKRLINALRSEQSEYKLPSGPQRAPEVATWLAENKELDVIPDRVPVEAPAFPLTVEELRQLATILQQTSREDWEQSLLDVPTDTWLPSAHAVEETYARLEDLRGQVTELEDSGLQVENLDTYRAEDLQRQIDFIKSEIEALRSISGEWESRFAESIRSGDPSVEWVLQHNPQVLDSLTKARALANDLVGHEVQVPDDDPTVVNELVDTWAKRIESGKKISWFSSKDLKQFAAEVKVDGYPVRTTAQLHLVRKQIHLTHLLKRTHKLMMQAYEHSGIPVPTWGEGFRFNAEKVADRIKRVHEWWTENYSRLYEVVRSLFKSTGSDLTVETLLEAVKLLESAAIRFEERELSASVERLVKKISAASKVSGASALWLKLLRAYELADAAGYNRIITEAQRLTTIREKVLIAKELLKRLRDNGAPQWENAIFSSSGDWNVIGDPEQASLAWERAKARTWLTKIHTETDIEKLMDESHEQSRVLRESIVEAVSKSATVELKNNMKDRQRRALESWLTAIRRVGKGTGKTAPRYQAAARDALPEAMGAVPIWIMPMYRVMENFDPRQSELFDVVIVDESSQCDLLSLGVLALGKKSVVVGDDKQTTPSRVGISVDRIGSLQDQYLRDVPEAKLLTLDDSLYSISARAFSSTIALKEHFRCVPEIIEFSNRFYSGAIQPLREASHPEIGDPIKVVYLEEAVSTKIGNSRVNEEEAEAIADQVAQCLEDPAYEGLTFGVVTMMSGPQAQLIQDLIRERVGDEEFEKRRLRVGNPPLFQGDERNIMFISMVAHDASFAATRLQHAQWANVAFSRAQDQLWIYHSMDHTTLHHEDQRRAMIDYALGYQRRSESQDLFEMTDSKFERDVLNQMLQRGYVPKPQYQVGRYRIDFVVEVAPGHRLAIECDGDKFHGPDRWDADVRRQRVLERLGWNFWRVRASRYYLDPEAAMQPLWDRLEAMKSRASQAGISEKIWKEIEQQNELVSARDEALAGNLLAAEEVKTTPADNVARDMTVEPVPQEPEVVGLLDSSNISAVLSAEKANTESSRLAITEMARARNWAKTNGYPLGERDVVPLSVQEAYRKSQDDRQSTSESSSDESVAPRAKELSKAPPVGVDLMNVWKVGETFQLKANGDILRQEDQRSLELIIGLRQSERIRNLMQSVRPGGGRFKIDRSGLMTTRIDAEVRYVGHLPKEITSTMLLGRK